MFHSAMERMKRKRRTYVCVCVCVITGGGGGDRDGGAGGATGAKVKRGAHKCPSFTHARSSVTLPSVPPSRHPPTRGLSAPLVTAAAGGGALYCTLARPPSNRADFKSTEVTNFRAVRRGVVLARLAKNKVLSQTSCLECRTEPIDRDWSGSPVGTLGIGFRTWITKDWTAPPVQCVCECRLLSY